MMLPQYMDLMDELSCNTFDVTTGSRPLARVETFVATDADGKFLGTASIQVRQSKDGRTGHITDVIVKEGYRKRGIGSRLMGSLVLAGYDLHCKKLDLTCEDTNIQFYLKNGFSLERKTDTGRIMIMNLETV